MTTHQDPPTGDTTIRFNGDERHLAPGTTLEQLVSEAVGPGHAGVAVAVDEEVVPAPRWAGRVLQQGERVELLTPVAGG
ncbi:sulfur carrier protein ThiS [Kytococcus sp. Marseille-QA3725]